MKPLFVYSNSLEHYMYHTRSRNNRRVAPLLAMGLLLGSAACNTETPTESLRAVANATSIQLHVEVDPTSLILVDPHNTVLYVGETDFPMRAQVVDQNGANIPGARAIWRSNFDTVAGVQALPDSNGVAGARMRVHGIGRGVALVIATYNNLADTIRVTVRDQSDTTIVTVPPPPPTPPPARPTTFDATIYVRGFVVANDTGSSGTLLLPGSVVTLTRLPLIAGDSLPPGVVPVTTATLFGTVTVGANSNAVFTRVPQSRFRVNVTGPSGTTWQAAEFTYGPPQVATFGRIMTLNKP